MINISQVFSYIILFGFTIFLLSGCVSNHPQSLTIPEGWEYVEMANGEFILYEPIKEKNGQTLYSRYDPSDPEGNHRELKGHEVRWQPLLTKKEIESKRWLQRKYKTLKY